MVQGIWSSLESLGSLSGVPVSVLGAVQERGHAGWMVGTDWRIGSADSEMSRPHSITISKDVSISEVGSPGLSV